MYFYLYILNLFRKCDVVKPIGEAAGELIADQKVQLVPSHLESTLKHINFVMDSIDKHIDNVQQKGRDCLAGLDAYEQKLVAKIRKLKTKARKEITSAQEEIISTAKESRNKCAEAKDLICKSIEEVKRSHGRKVNSAVLKKKGQELVTEGGAICRASEDMIKNKTLSFSNDSQIEDSLKPFSSLIIDVNRYTGRQAPTSLSSAVPKTEKFNIRKTSDINMKISSDKQDCDILGCCRLEDGTLILSDNDNTNLKHVDPFTGKVTDYRDMKNKPWGVCSVGPQEVAVSSKHILINTLELI